MSAVTLYQTWLHVVPQQLNLLPVPETSGLLIFKVSECQGTVRALKEEMVRSDWFFVVRLTGNVCQRPANQDCFNFNHYRLENVDGVTLRS